MNSSETNQRGGSASLRSRAFRAGRWIFLGHFSGLVVRFAGTIVLTRIFSPDVFGILAVIMSVQVILTLLTDIGLRQAVIQSPNGGDLDFLRTAFSLQILRGVFVWLLCVLFSVALAFAISYQLLPTQSVYANANLPLYLIVASLSSILLGFQSTKAITASRNLQVERVSILEFVVQLVSLAFLVGVGLLTRSIWSYIYGMLFSAAITTVLTHFFLKGPRDRLGWSRSAAKQLFRFGRWTFLSSTLSAFAANGDKLLLGGWLNAQTLGLYSVSSNLVSVPEGLANRMFGAVSFPALSEAARSRPERFAGIYLRMRWFSDAALLFIAGLLFSAGSSIVGILYDARYASAGWMLQYLSFSLVFTRYGIAQSAYLALGLPQYVTLLSLAKLVSLFSLTTVLFYIHGVQGAVLGIAFHMFLTSACTVYLSSKHGLNSARLELGVLACWIVGWVAGYGIDIAYELLRANGGAIRTFWGI